LNSKDRQHSIREVERHVEKLVRSGWRLEKLEHVDEPGQPFRTVVSIAKDGTTSADEAL